MYVLRARLFACMELWRSFVWDRTSCLGASDEAVIAPSLPPAKRTKNAAADVALAPFADVDVPHGPRDASPFSPPAAARHLLLMNYNSRKVG